MGGRRSRSYPTGLGPRGDGVRELGELKVKGTEDCESNRFVPGAT